MSESPPKKKVPQFLVFNDDTKMAFGKQALIDMGYASALKYISAAFGFPVWSKPPRLLATFIAGYGSKEGEEMILTAVGWEEVMKNVAKIRVVERIRCESYAHF